MIITKHSLETIHAIGSKDDKPWTQGVHLEYSGAVTATDTKIMVTIHPPEEDTIPTAVVTPTPAVSPRTLTPEHIKRIQKNITKGNPDFNYIDLTSEDENSKTTATTIDKEGNNTKVQAKNLDVKPPNLGKARTDPDTDPLRIDLGVLAKTVHTLQKVFAGEEDPVLLLYPDTDRIHIKSVIPSTGQKVDATAALMLSAGEAK